MASNDSVPKVLEERLLIDSNARKILGAMENLSPRDTANLYVPRNVDKHIPTFKDIADVLGMPEDDVRSYVSNIKQVWKLPEHLPTDNGRVSEDQALINALTNEHKLRFDPEINDYRVPRIHEFNGELGLGMLYTNNKAFEGQRIFRNAMGYTDSMNSVHFQGGLLPTIVSFYSKTNNNRALLTGLNKTGKVPSEKEIAEVRSLIELSKKAPLRANQVKNIEKYIVNTIDSLSEAARSAAHEFAPLVKDLPEHVPIHLNLSYNDDFNISQQEDLFITSMRDTLKKSETAELKLPNMYSDKKIMQNQLTYEYVHMEVADFILGNLKTKYKKGATKGAVSIKKNSKLYLNELIKQNIFDNKSLKPELDALIKELKEQYALDKGRVDVADFNRIFNDAKNRYTSKNSKFDTIDQITKDYEQFESNKSRIATKLSEVNDKIAELEQYAAARIAEAREGHAWLTKKYAIRPTDSKAMFMMLKDFYKGIYESEFIPEVKKLAGKDLKILLHMDREISVFVEDPATQLGLNTYSKEKLYGTIVTSIPRTNRQRSNEPLGDSFTELQGKHSGAISEWVKNGMKRPKTKKEFNKHQSSAISDIVYTSFGADGYRLQPKFILNNTTVEGEYRGDTHTTWYLKLPTRHDMATLGDLMKKGNKSTVEGKRLDKGGATTGNFIYIMHPNQSPEGIFVDDRYYEFIADKYSSKILDIESKLAKETNDLAKSKLQSKLQKIYSEIKPELFYGLLANDLHIGAANMPGTPTNVDYIKASQQAILQSIGPDKIKAVTASEIPNGNLNIGRKFVTSEVGYSKDPLTLEKEIQMLAKGLSRMGKTTEEILAHTNAYYSEQANATSIFRTEQQKYMFEELVIPPFNELLKNNTQLVFASGNHYNMSRPEDEAAAFTQLFDIKYRDLGLVKAIPANGEGFSFAPIRLPSKEGLGKLVMLTHKMQTGGTEVSRMANQAVGNRHEATLYLAADAHQPGVVAEKGKYLVLDAGKQGPGSYPLMIGKTDSVRGSMVFGYGANNEQILPVRFYLDNVVDTMIGWKEKSEMLKTSHNIIREEYARTYK